MKRPLGVSRSTMRRFVVFLMLAGFSLCCRPLPAQLSFDPTEPATSAAEQLTNPALSPGEVFLFELEAKFEQATAAGGGKAFASWFAEDGVILANGKAPTKGSFAIAASATWLPKDYQLTWTPESGELSGDMGYTWGHYVGHAKDAAGNPVTTTGRYMTIWKKQPDGSWKIELDASNEEPPGAGDCCRIQ